VVLDAGRVVEAGPPADLAARDDGRYAAMLQAFTGATA
jgi:ABC-type multidrug transport system fused ATPase/permease subunit